MFTKKQWVELAQGPLLLIGAGIFILVMGLFHLWNGISSLTWQPVPGVVTISEKETHYSTKQPAGKKIFYFHYSYQVDGKKFNNKRYSFAGGVNDSRGGVNAYKKGDPVTVFYNPRNPAEAVIEKGPSWVKALWCIAGLLVLIGSIFWARAQLTVQGDIGAG